MTSEPDLASALDAAIGEGPAHRPPGDVLAAGRRRLRRRRVTAGAGLAVAAAVAAVALVGGTGSDRADRGVDPAAPSGTATSAGPTPSATTGAPTSPASPDPDPEDYLLDGDEVALTPDGELVTAPGVEVLRRLPNPYGYQPPNHSLGISYRFEGETTWALLDYTVDRDGNAGSSTSSDPARKAFSRLEDWVADQVAINSDNVPPPFTFVEFRGATGERLRPLAGVEILQQTGDVDLPADFAGPDDRTAVAEVERQGRRWWVLARELPGGPPEYLPVDAAVGGATLEAFLDYARRQYGSGEGVR